MATNTQLQTKSSIAKGIGAVRNSDECVAFRIRNTEFGNIGNNTHDAILTTASDLELKTNGSTDATLSFSTYTTLGDLVDAINNLDYWEAEIVAGLRSDNVDSSELLDRSSSTFLPRETVEFQWDSSNHSAFDVALENVDVPFESEASEHQNRVAFSRAITKQDNDGSDLQLKIYEVDQERDNSELIGSFDVVDNTEKDTGGDKPELHSDYGNEILVRLESTNIQDNGYLRVYGERE